MENSHHDQEPGLRSTSLMGWIVGTTGCHACEERTDIYVRTLCGPMMGRETHHEERRLRSPWWMGRARLSYGPHDGKRECAHEERPFTESLLDGWKCAATAVCNSRQGRTDKDVYGGRD